MTSRQPVVLLNAYVCGRLFLLGSLVLGCTPAVSARNFLSKVSPARFDFERISAKRQNGEKDFDLFQRKKLLSFFLLHGRQKAGAIPKLIKQVFNALAKSLLTFSGVSMVFGAKPLGDLPPR